MNAESNVNDNSKLTKEQKNWLLAIIKILKEGGYARVMADCCLIDIANIAYTPSFAASFYDVYNHLDRYVTSVMPIRIKNLVNDYHQLYKHEGELW